MNKYELLQMDPRDALPAVEGDAYCDKVDKIVGRTSRSVRPFDTMPACDRRTVRRTHI